MEAARAPCPSNAEGMLGIRSMQQRLGTAGMINHAFVASRIPVSHIHAWAGRQRISAGSPTPHYLIPRSTMARVTPPPDPIGRTNSRQREHPGHVNLHRRGLESRATSEEIAWSV